MIRRYFTIGITSALCAIISQPSVGGRFRAALNSKNKENRLIKVDIRNGTITGNGINISGIRDCSDKYQNCLTNGRGFSFSYFKKCGSGNVGDFTRLRFNPKIVSAVGNDIWMVFDNSKNYMFHYVVPRGVVGIYIGASPKFDFRRLLTNRNLRLADLRVPEYNIESPRYFLGCQY